MGCFPLSLAPPSPHLGHMQDSNPLQLSGAAAALRLTLVAFGAVALMGAGFDEEDDSDAAFFRKRGSCMGFNFMRVENKDL